MCSLALWFLSLWMASYRWLSRIRWRSRCDQWWLRPAGEATLFLDRPERAAAQQLQFVAEARGHGVLSAICGNKKKHKLKSNTLEEMSKVWHSSNASQLKILFRISVLFTRPHKDILRSLKYEIRHFKSLSWALSNDAVWKSLLQQLYRCVNLKCGYALSVHKALRGNHQKDQVRWLN